LGRSVSEKEVSFIKGNAMEGEKVDEGHDDAVPNRWEEER